MRLLAPDLAHVRHLIQPELAMLRDFVAEATGLSPQTVQDAYENVAPMLNYSRKAS